MLFIVHREQIARQALKSFRIVLGDAAGSFGLLSGNEKASECDFVFATMQTLAKTAVLQTFPKDAFAFIIIDEVHRAGAPQLSAHHELVQTSLLARDDGQSGANGRL